MQQFLAVGKPARVMDHRQHIPHVRLTCAEITLQAHIEHGQTRAIAHLGAIRRSLDNKRIPITTLLNGPAGMARLMRALVPKSSIRHSSALQVTISHMAQGAT